MKKVLSIFLVFSFMLNGAWAEVPTNKQDKFNHYQFFMKEFRDVQSKKDYKFNRYEDIISGLSAFIIGNIGYFATDSDSLKIAYGFVQTIGILNVGKGIYNYYKPNPEREYYHLISSQSSIPVRDRMDYLSEGIIKIIAFEKRATRLSLFYTSALLSVQYGINIFLDDAPEDIENIFVFLGSVNLIVAGYSFFVKDKYEEFYFKNKKLKDYEFKPVTGVFRDSPYLGLNFRYTF